VTVVVAPLLHSQCLITQAGSKKQQKDTSQGSKTGSSSKTSSSKAGSSSKASGLRDPLDRELALLGLRVKSITADGNCFFRALSDQLQVRVQRVRVGFDWLGSHRGF